MTPEDIYEAIKERYSSASQPTKDGQYESAVAKSFGYSEEELKSIPKEANLGLSCGNPLATAALQEGEVVVDLGCGAGFDIFLAAKRVGYMGKAIGVDMNEEMLAKANSNKEKACVDNVQFVQAPITDMNVLSSMSADCVISNCVVNLVPETEKQLVFHEMARLLRPGGRVAISDILLKKDLPPSLQSNLALYVGCISGASKVEEYEKYLNVAGFKDILIIDAERNLNVYKEQFENKDNTSCCGGVKEKVKARGYNEKGPKKSTDLAKELDFNSVAGSFMVYAMKER
ncbi:putative ubiE/COQ5 methyltransferase [Patellaria atrata CBS 101060]|uniref:Arsenite methyltransferase n=1 Tax=Patellaria atrata CBS 101060 TaxID=1346257 RepID=A0A9P4VRM2_9PEZI|nr:putative ubiE/COQ5 methyltransferase [Patellaria atrata CBS 101060]